jgi:predicted Fe-Mo cluster-binding NifX family protein
MKIAIASEGKDESSQVSDVSGRAPYYLIFEDKKLVKAIKNPFTIGGGAGFSVAQMLINEGVELVISGNFGKNMQGMLDSKKIRTLVVTGKTVKEAVEEAMEE